MHLKWLVQLLVVDTYVLVENLWVHDGLEATEYSKDFLKEQCVFQQQKTKYRQNVLSNVSIWTTA